MLKIKKLKITINKIFKQYLKKKMLKQGRKNYQILINKTQKPNFLKN